MTITTHHQLDHLRSEWQALAHSQASRRAARTLLDHRPDLVALEIRDLGDVLRLLEPSGGLDATGRAGLAAALLETAACDALIARALLQTLLPGLVSVARKLRWGQRSGDTPATFLADLITITFELISEWAGQRRPYAAPDILNAVRCRMRRRLTMEAEHTTVSLDVPDRMPIEAATIRDPDPTESISALLSAYDGQLDPVGVAGVYGREVLGLTYRELAEMTGISSRRLAAASRDVARRILE